MPNRRVSKHGLELIKAFEGCKLKAYRDVAGIWTIGYGHTKGVYPGQVITIELAEKFLIDDVWNFEEEVNLILAGVEVSQAQFDALVSFAFNVGSDIDADDIPEGLGDSTLLKKLLAGDTLGAADQFLSWNKAKVRGKLQPVAGLTKRRAAERALFLS